MYKSKFIDGTDATEYQAAIAPIIHEIADAVSEADEQTPIEWADLWAAMDADPDRWFLTTETMFYAMLEAVPPQDMESGGFLVGEAHHHNAEGEAVYACFTSHASYQARYMTQREFDGWKVVHR